MQKEELIKKWLTDELTMNEQKEFESFEDYDFHKKIMDGAQFFKATDVAQIKDYEDFISYKNKVQTKQQNWLQPILKIAAVVVLTLGLGSLYFVDTNPATTEIASAGVKNKVLLPDNSTVMINAGSEISFASKNWDANRKVTMKGEAFFDVEKGATFDVMTDAGTVTVLGTEFNVKNRENYFEVTCYEGLVSVTIDEKNYQLPAGNKLRMIDDKVILGTVSQLTPSWINAMSQFKSVPFSQVLDELERQYNVQITSPNIDKKKLFTGGFVHNNLKESLNSITLPLELSYKVSEDKKYITFIKK